MEEACSFALSAHRDQKRASGQPYIMHPLNVALLLAQNRLDISSIVAGLLHDTVEDTSVDLKDIKMHFGDEVEQLVAGLTKLSRMEGQTYARSRAENFRKLVLSMSKDVRVLVIKLMDRLHNIRTLHHIKSLETRRRIAQETIDIYAPLAERIGMHSVQGELDDLSFSTLHPETHIMLLRRIAEYCGDGNNIIDIFSADLRKVLGQAGIKVRISGRIKRPYSIWNKMQKKHIQFEEFSDIVAFRVIVDSVPACYHALGVIHSNFSVLPEGFKDYISTPKPNHYQSIHTTVLSDYQKKVEVQIRTKQMHEVAESGLAAHWFYKQKEGIRDGKEYRWLKGLLDILDQSIGVEEFLEHTKLEIYQDRVFVFTEKGDLVDLPRGATVIDFAYALHSDIGNHCSSVRINGRLVPLRTELSNGDQVTIKTEEAAHPLPSWERFAVTGKARSNIRRFIQRQRTHEFHKLGKALLDERFQHRGHRGVLDKVRTEMGSATWDDFYKGIAQGRYDLDDIVQMYNKRATEHMLPHKQEVIIEGMVPGMAMHYSECCHPLPGDPIVGLLSKGKGIDVHVDSCSSLKGISQAQWVDLSWGRLNKQGEYLCQIHVTLANGPGSLGVIATLIGKAKGNITNLKIMGRQRDFFDLSVDVLVTSAHHLDAIIASLRTTSIVHSIKRV